MTWGPPLLKRGETAIVSIMRETRELKKLPYHDFRARKNTKTVKEQENEFHKSGLLSGGSVGSKKL